MKVGNAFTFALPQVLLLSACLAASKPAATSQSAQPEGFQQQLSDACGRPVLYPISTKCIGVMGSVGPLLQRRSDLVVKIWRSCANDNPCYRIASTDPACGGRVTPVRAGLFGADNDSCRRAQQADYSCAAMLNDLAYTDPAQQPDGAQGGDYECMRAKSALVEFDQEIDRMSVRIQWYRAFAAQGF
jgi:hypothetical protein